MTIMVYAFIIHTLNPSSVGSDVCRVLYSCTFAAEDTSDDTGGQPALNLSGEFSQDGVDQRTFRKEQLALVAGRVKSEYSFRKSLVVKDPFDQSMHSAGSFVEAPTGNSEIGMLRLAPGDPFQMERIAVWMGQGSVGFTLVCEKSENRLLAEGVLKLLSRYLQDHVQAVTQPAEVLSRGDRIAIIVHQFLPGGRLLFMNYAVIRQIEKDMDNLLRGK